MNPTAGSFIINPRLQRLFMTLAMDFPGQDSLMKIYGTFLQVRGSEAEQQSGSLLVGSLERGDCCQGWTLNPPALLLP